MDSKYSYYGNGNKNGGNGERSFNSNNNLQCPPKSLFTTMEIKRKSVSNGIENGNGVNNKKHRNDNDNNVGTSSSLSYNGDSNNYRSGLNSSYGSNKVFEQRQALPVYAVKNELSQHILNNSTLIIISETGSGKTTQIPQFIHEFGMSGHSVIAVTQPRRVAAITIAKRVAAEMGSKLGDTVGYTVRFEDLTSKQTKIKYMTDGILLREALSDRLLKQYRYIILDEAHERTIDTDILFGIVKEAQTKRRMESLPSLTVILMSATMDVDHFSKYFNDCKTIYLEGRQFPVKIMNTKQPHADYSHAVLSTFFEIHKSAPPIDHVLIFLTGQEEIDAMVTQIRSITKSNQVIGPQLRVFPLYAQMTQAQQLEAFNAVQPNTRKVIVATNVAETSLTINGIKYVIDCGMVKRRIYESGTCMEILKEVRISQAQACQRAGRAGRESDGFCYRTYTNAEFKAMAVNTTPEILRSNVTTNILQLLALGIDPQKFDFIDKPPKESIEYALKTLHQLSAISSPKASALTFIGHKMAKFPLDPRYSRMILASANFECMEEILSIIAMLSSDNVFLNPNDKRELALVAHSKFDSKYGDHLRLLNIYRGFIQSEKQKVWCSENFLNFRNLGYAREVRSQLLEICKRCDLKIASCGSNLDQVRKCLIIGLFSNIAEFQRDNTYLTLTSRQRAKIHPTSILHNKARSSCVIYSELVLTSRTFMRTVTIIDPEWIEEILPNSEIANRLGRNTNNFNNNYNRNSDDSRNSISYIS